ncbi:hypothetical protein NDU88_004195 [Pleurodeles waltl]|uniref:Uncharacterized protein n=1 Tax=Pleurodeles waltl TaxID=8319 RepID=A0AAV7LKY7_PLEWA|nr:hypothetical protein NDU88_004195 [Pleurodeles waltl]
MHSAMRVCRSQKEAPEGRHVSRDSAYQLVNKSALLEDSVCQTGACLKLQARASRANVVLDAMRDTGENVDDMVSDDVIAKGASAAAGSGDDRGHRVGIFL